MNQKIYDQLPDRIKPFIGQGKVADYIPALAAIPADKFGIASTTVDGMEYHCGDASENFSVQSISKVFALIIALQILGDSIWDTIGRRLATKAFNAITPLEEASGTPRNPFTNGGAIALVDKLLYQRIDYTSELLKLVHHLSGNSNINFDHNVALSEKNTGHRNIAIAQILKSYGVLQNPVEEVLDAYYTQCSLAMSCADLSRSFLFLANSGHNPLDNRTYVTPVQSRRINALLLMFGTYDAAGDFVFRIGLPGKSGVGGGIVAVVPGSSTIAVWSPSLDDSGTSVVGLKALEFLTETLEISIL